MNLAGRLLIASRTLRDPNFLKTVVLILEHGEEGALGVVLNRPTDRTLGEVWDAIDADPIANKDTLWRGGPVPGPLIGLHNDPELGEKQVLPGVYMSMQRDALDQLVRQERCRYRIYSGNSGWGGGQLEGEIKAGGWLTGDSQETDLFAEPDGLWPAVTKRIGLGIMLPGVAPDDLPPEVGLN